MNAITRFKKLIRTFIIASIIAAPVMMATGDNTIRFEAAAAPEWDELFVRTEGWIGADGNYSVPMGDDRTLWLFSDTWVGEVRDGKRVNARMINNSVGLQDGIGGPVEFFYRTREDGSADSLIKPADGRGFYWLFGGVRTDSGLYLFLKQVTIVTPGSAFGFQGIGTWLGYVENPDASPLDWEVRQEEMPCSIYTDDGSLSFGAAAFKDGGYVYIYGNETRRREGIEQGVVVARVREEDMGDFAKWRYYRNGEWQEDFTRATLVAPPIGSEYSVSLQPILDRYIMVYTEGLSGRAKFRTAPAPVGPWSEPTEFFRAPEMDWEGSLFCYAGKAHPHLSSGRDELMVTYASNSLVGAEVVGNARLYMPRFVRLRFPGY